MRFPRSGQGSSAMSESATVVGGRRVALITGAGSGIGAATARLMHAHGWHVVLCGRRPQPITSLAAELDGLAVPTDVRDPAAVRELFAAIDQHHGRLDGAVLNAGTIYSRMVAEHDDAQWSDTLRTNLDGAMYVARESLSRLERTGGSMVAVA